MIQKARGLSQRQEFFKRLYDALERGRHWLEDRDIFPEPPPKNNFALKAFTDNIVLAWPVLDDAESEFGLAFLKLAYFQLQMVKSGFFIRGALSVADAFVDEIAVFGSALTESYKGESELARDPRIILTSTAVKTVKGHLKYYARGSAPHSRELLRDSDGQWFLNYLEFVLMPLEEGGDPFYEDLLGHKSQIEDHLRQFKSRPSIWSKYAWVAGYHNYFCNLHPKYFDNRHKIAIDLFRASQSPIVK